METKNEHDEPAAEQPTAKTRQSPEPAQDAAGNSQPNGQLENGQTNGVSTSAQGSDQHDMSASSGAAPLAPGTRIGAYTLGRLVRDVPGHRLYVATTESPGAEEARYLLQEVPAETPEGSLQAIMGAGLQHPRVLVPTERLPFAGRSFLLLAGMPASSAPPRVASEGEQLAPVEVLRAGAGLADALSYLHRNEFAHLHVSPDVVVLQDERAYLAGLENALPLGEAGDRDALALVAQDANDLGRTLGMLAHVSAMPSEGASEAVQVLGAIATQAAAGTLATPDEIAAACGSGLQVNAQALPPAAQTSDAPLRLHYGVGTTVGCVRSENQDAAAAVLFNVLDDATGPHVPMGIFLVADGMGGEAHGELASRIAARTVPAELVRLYVLPAESYPALAVTEPTIGAPEISAQSLAQALNEAVAIANGRIRDMADYFRQDTGTTLTALAISGHEAIIAHLGDSRAYLLRDGALIQLTEDHTLLARLQAMDHPILSDAAFYVPRNFLYRSLGQEQSPPDLLELTLAPGDRVLICSDGLWDEVDDATIQRELVAASDPTACAERLVTLANEAGGHDNSTALVLFVHAAPPIIAATTGEEGAAEATS